MDELFESSYLKLQRYKGKIVALGALTPITTPGSKVYGTYKYIHIESCDSTKKWTLDNVIVYVGCAPYLQENAEVELIYGLSLDQNSNNTILAIHNGNTWTNDYSYFFNQIDTIVDSLKSQRASWKKSTAATIGMSVLFCWLVFPIFIGIYFGINIYKGHKILSDTIAGLEKNIPTELFFNKLLETTPQSPSTAHPVHPGKTGCRS